jgi:hypothetical protein
MVNSSKLVVVSGSYELELIRSALLHLASGDSIVRERHARLDDLRMSPSERLSAQADQLSGLTLFRASLSLSVG